MRRSRLIPFCAALAFAGAALADSPRRVVTMNHCADQYALLLAAPGQVVSVSHIALDPFLSAMADEAADVPKNRGGAEEIYRLEPDLVLASTWSDPLAVGMLERLGIRVERVDGVERLADIPGRLREVGALLGQEAVAEEMARGVEARLAALPEPGGTRPEAAFFHAGGYSLGEGTLAHDILTRAGFDNLADRVGRTDGGYIPVEVLIMNRPDLLITSGAYPGSSQAEALMDHPAIADIPRVESDAVWACGLPATLDAVEALIRLFEGHRN
jgi:iron complex transport system substrate-binding protein